MTDCLRIFLPPLQNFVNTVYHISFLIQAQRGALISERLCVLSGHFFELCVRHQNTAVICLTPELLGRPAKHDKTSRELSLRISMENSARLVAQIRWHRAGAQVCPLQDVPGSTRQQDSTLFYVVGTALGVWSTCTAGGSTTRQHRSGYLGRRPEPAGSL